MIALHKIGLFTGLLLVLGVGCDASENDVKQTTAQGDEIRTNRLIHETSPYLLQHAHNPVDWYAWGAEALDRARKEDKPIFLSIGYSACHWCHVMAHESFENEAIAELLNRSFVSIKVDREERPDIDGVYMNAVQMLTGSGGWPLTVFLTPDLKPFYGGTYFPPEDRFGRPGFGSLLSQIAAAWAERRSELDKSAEQITEALQRSLRVQAGGEGGVVTLDLLDGAAETLASQFDSRWGGFGGAPKFPPSGALSLLLRQYRRTGSEPLLNMVTFTLNCMAAGGVYDHLGGGFHRYAVDEQWLVPHFEKMLYDNALLSHVYLEAYQVTGDDNYRRVACETLDYILRDMTDENGGFYSSEDADSEGKEGKFYVWTREEALPLLGGKHAGLFCDYYDLTEQGNFEGASILHTPRPAAEFAEDHKMTTAELDSALAPLRSRLLAHRGGRVRPGKDDKVLTSWNGLAISSFAAAFRVTGTPRYGDAAVKASTFILKNMADGDDLKHTYRAGQARVDAFLDDYAFLCDALIDVYEMTSDLHWLESAEGLADDMLSRFRDGDDGAFYLTARGQNRLPAREQPLHDGSVPSGNAIAARALFRLGALVGRKAYTEAARQTLAQAAPLLELHPGAFNHMLCAVHCGLAMREVALIGRHGQADTGRLQAVLDREFVPDQILVRWDPEREEDADLPKKIPLLAGKSLVDGRAATYVCKDYACAAPVTNAAALADLLSRP